MVVAVVVMAVADRVVSCGNLVTRVVMVGQHSRHGGKEHADRDDSDDQSIASQQYQRRATVSRRPLCRGERRHDEKRVEVGGRVGDADRSRFLGSRNKCKPDSSRHQPQRDDCTMQCDAEQPHPVARPADHPKGARPSRLLPSVEYIPTPYEPTTPPSKPRRRLPA